MKRETEQRDAVGVTGATDDRHASTCDATDACRRSILKLGFGAFATGALGFSGAARAQSGSLHRVAYVDVGALNAEYRAFGIVQPGIRLPADQAPACDSGDPDAGCAP